MINRPITSAAIERSASQRLDALLAVSASIVWWTNAAGEFVDEQPYWQAYTGQTWEEYRGSGWVSALHPDDRAGIVEDWTRAAAAGGPYFSEGRIWSSQHQAYRAFQTRGIAIRDEDGAIHEWLGALTDVQDTMDIKVLLESALADQARTLKDLRLSEATTRAQTAEQHASEARLAADLEAMTRLHHVGTIFVRDGDLEPVLGAIVETAIAISKADFGNIQLIDAASSDLTIVTQRGLPEWWVDYWNTIGRGQGTCGAALERGKRVIVEDVERSPVFVGPVLEIQRKAGIRAVQSTPLMTRAGRCLGMFSTHYKTPQQPDERALRFLDLLARHAADIIERANDERALRESNDRLVALMQSAMDGVIAIDSNQRIVLFNPAAERMFACAATEAIGSPLDRFIPETMRLAHRDHVRQFGATGVTTRRMGQLGALAAVRADGAEFPIEAAISQVTVDGQKLYTAIVRDITERKEAEANRQFLMRELAHRMKNQLAIVQAMVRQTAHGASSITEFKEQLTKRVQGLAVGTDLLAIGGWTGTDLAELVKRQLEPFNPGATKLLGNGPAVRIGVDATEAISLALHELATNSVKHGAWSVADGTVSVNWHVEADGAGEPGLRLTWVERGGPAVAPPARKGFGHVVIESMVARKTGGEAQLMFAPEGLSWTLTLPASHLG